MKIISVTHPRNTQSNLVIQKDIEDVLHTDIPWNVLYKSTVVVSGAGGFIASYIVNTLLYLNTMHNAGITVLALVRSREKATDKFSEHGEEKRLKLVVHDVNNPLEIDGNVDFIIHAASRASPSYYSKAPVDSIKPNITGTMNLLDLAKRKGTKSFLFISSGEIYGLLKDNRISIRESDYGSVDPTSVRSCYAESKRMGENICVSYCYEFGVPVKIVRPFHIYGPGMAMDDGRVQADFVSNVVAGEDIVMKSDGKNYRTFCYISDAVRAFFTVLLKGKNGEAYNVGNDTAEIQISKLASLLANRISGGKIRVIRKDREKSEHYRESPIERCRPNIEKMKSLGWKPRYSLEEGFRRTIESYRV